MPLDEIHLEAHLSPRLLVKRVIQRPYLFDHSEFDFLLSAAKSILTDIFSMIIAL